MSDRLLISKLVGREIWSVTSNPSWNRNSISMNQLMLNFGNDYVEYRNCGVQHRMIRIEDCTEYGIDFDDIKSEWKLNAAEQT
jgi:hypothetical protein